MGLKKIVIKNLKLIENAVIEPGKVTQIVGENNQGKTTVLEAIEIGMTGSKDSRKDKGRAAPRETSLINAA